MLGLNNKSIIILDFKTERRKFILKNINFLIKSNRYKYRQYQ